MERGDFSQAESIRQKIERKEEEAAIQAEFGGGGDFRQSLKDMAKAEGIDTFGMTSDEIRKALSERIREKNKEEKDKKDGKEKKDEVKEDPVKQSVDTLHKVVETIRDIVGRIEPKLPTVALAN